MYYFNNQNQTCTGDLFVQFFFIHFTILMSNVLCQRQRVYINTYAVRYVRNSLRVVEPFVYTLSYVKRIAREGKTTTLSIDVIIEQ